MERYRITPAGGLYFCTFSIVDWLPVFVSEAPCLLVCESLSFCHEHKPLGIDSFWQFSRRPVAVESEKLHIQKRDYLHDNPRRKGFVLDAAHWRWSSARWYATEQMCDVPITPVMC